MKGLAKLPWKILVLELVIVFIGVYMAFILSNYQNELKSQKDANKIFTNLKEELEYFRMFFPGRASFQKSKNEEWQELKEAGKYHYFYSWRFIQPQYDFTTLEYALKTSDNEIIDFELFNRLNKVFRELKQLEHKEMLLTEIGFLYRNVDFDQDRAYEEWIARNADNQLNFHRFMDISKLREQSFIEVSESATICLDLINSKIGKKKQKEIEARLIKESLAKVDPNKNLNVAYWRKRLSSSFTLFEPVEIDSLVAPYYR